MDQFPQNLRELPPALEGFIASGKTVGLDLTAIGYMFLAVGQCNVPGEKSVHLIYRSNNDSTGQDTISLWIRRYGGSPDITPDKPHVVTGTNTANPLLVWRHAGMIYYVVANTLGTVENASNMLWPRR